MKRRIAPLCLVGSLLLAAPANGQGTLYSVWEQSLVRFDPNTLERTVIGPFNTQFYGGDLTWHHVAEQLFMYDGHPQRLGGALWSLDRDTGALRSHVGWATEGNIAALEQQPRNRLLGWATRARGDQGLYEVEVFTASLRLIGDPGVPLDGLAFDTRRDILIGLDAEAGTLYEIDPSTAAITLVRADDPVDAYCGMTYDPDRDLLWLIDATGTLYTIDPNSHYERTAVARGLGPHGGLAYVPDLPPGPRITLAAVCPVGGTVFWFDATPDRDMGVFFASNRGEAMIPFGPCGGTTLGLGRRNLHLVRLVSTGPRGSWHTGGELSPAACGGYLQVVVADGSPCSTSNVVQIPR